MISPNRISIIGFGCALALAIVSADALAQTDPLEQLSEEQLVELLDLLSQADSAERDRQWTRALETYQRAADIVSLPEYTYRQAFCLEHLDRKPEALEMYQELVDSGGDSGAVASAEQRLEALLAEPVTVEVLSTPSGSAVSIDGDSVGSTPVVLQLPPGEYDLLVSHDGYDSFEQEILLEPLTPVVLTASLEVTGTSIVATERPIRWWTISLGVGALAAAGVGTWMGAVSIVAENDWNDAKQGGDSPSSRGDADHFSERASDSARIANYSFIFAGALAAGALISLYFDLTRDAAEEDETLTWHPAVSPTFAGGVLEWRF